MPLRLPPNRHQAAKINLKQAQALCSKENGRLLHTKMTNLHQIAMALYLALLFSDTKYSIPGYCRQALR